MDAELRAVIDEKGPWTAGRACRVARARGGPRTFPHTVVAVDDGWLLRSTTGRSLLLVTRPGGIYEVRGRITVTAVECARWLGQHRLRQLDVGPGARQGAALDTDLFRFELVPIHEPEEIVRARNGQARTSP